jgi:hypothetical protein
MYEGVGGAQVDGDVEGEEAQEPVEGIESQAESSGAMGAKGAIIPCASARCSRDACYVEPAVL